MTPAPIRRITLAASALAATALLAACGAGGIQHGTVIGKRYQPSYVTGVYKSIYRQTNCRTVTSDALTLAFTRGRSSHHSSSHSGGSSSSEHSSSSKHRTSHTHTHTHTTTKRVCDRRYVGREQTGTRHHAAAWELHLKKGKRTGWKKVSQTVWNRTKVGAKV